MIIIDSTTLIHFNKAGLELIFKEFEIVIPEAVFNEVVVSGRKDYKQDASTTEKLIKEKTIKVLKIKDGLRKELNTFGNLGQGEIEVLCLAKENNWIAIIDDSSARKIGKLFNIEVNGSFYLIFYLLQKRKITKQEAKNILSKLISSGWYCSMGAYDTIIQQIEEL